MAFKKKETPEFKVGGVNIKIGERYILDHLTDPNSKVGTKKFPFNGSGVTDCVFFDDKKNLYDTGFYESSWCLQSYSEAEKEELVPIYVNQIMKPYASFRNADLTPTDKNEFWKNFRYEAKVNKEFDTTKPDDLFELFQIIIQGLACEKNEKKPFYRQNAQFTISNPQTTKNKNKERSKTKIKAIQKLITLADGDKDKLDLVLNFVGRESTNKVDKEDLKTIYFEVINDPKTGVDFAERFLEACEDYETSTGQEKMEFFHAVNELTRLRKIRKDARRGYLTEHGDVFLGNTLQDIAKFCIVKDSVQSKAIEELIEQNPQVRREV